MGNMLIVICNSVYSEKTNSIMIQINKSTWLQNLIFDLYYEHWLTEIQVKW